jgi:hypothetical protein
VPFATINSTTGAITIDMSAPQGKKVISVLAKDSTGFEYYQNYTLVGSINNLPEYPSPLPDIVMTSGETKSQEISGYTNPDADSDTVSIF